jgi:hypothetical protein
MRGSMRGNRSSLEQQKTNTVFYRYR